MRRGPLPFLMATLFLDAVGIGLVFPVMPALLRELGRGAAEDAALWGGVLAAAFAAMQVVCAPLLGALSDRWGRRPVLLLSLAAMAVDYAASALVGSIWALLALRVLGGATAATHATANAALSDLTDPEDRARGFGRLGAAFMAGFVLGPVIGGVLGEWGTRLPFWVAAGLAAANLALGWLTLPETVPAAARRPFDLGRALPWGAMRAVARLGRGPGGARGLLLVLFLQDLAFLAYPAIWAFWGQAAFGWTAFEVGASLAAFGLVAALVQGWALPFYLARLGETGTILFGFGYNLLVFVAFALLPPTPLGGWIALAFCPVSALGEVTAPALQGRLSRLVPADAQGEAQGVVAAVRSVATVVGPLVMTALFAWGAGAWGFYGTAYLAAALLMAACLALLARGAT